MPTPMKPPAFPIGAIDAQRVEDALSPISPRWTTWSAMTLAEKGRPMRVREVASRLPFVGEQYVSKRLAKMQADGLVTRDDHRGAPYRLSALGETLSPIFHALSDWSHAYLPLGHVAEAERVEDALRRLHHRHSTAVIQILDAGGPMRYAHIAEEAGLSNSLGGQQLSRLQTAGLIARTGPRHGDPYTLTDGGRALGAVYATVEHWSEPVATLNFSSGPVHVAAATRTHTNVPRAGDGARTAAALRRSAAVSNDLFSHAPQPQVPAAVTTRSAPGRGR